MLVPEGDESLARGWRAPALLLLLLAAPVPAVRPQVRVPAFRTIKLHPNYVMPVLKVILLILCHSPAPSCINSISPLCIVSKFPQCTLSSYAKVINQNFKEVSLKSPEEGPW